MSKAHKKYLREQKVKDDNEQIKFMKNGNIENVETISKLPLPEEVKNNKVSLDTIVYCPFCLHRNKKMKFLTTDVKGEISTYKVQCPECRQKMLMRTVDSLCNITSKVIEAYAKWVMEYKRGFWNKVKKPIWDKRLKRYNWSGIFWKRYKELKASIPRDYDEEDDEYKETKEGYLKWKEEHPDG